MQDTGQDKKSYRVLLLLVVGLAAFSTAMKELNQVQDLAMQTSNLFAQWKEMIAPAPELTTSTVETCQNSKTLVPPAPPTLPALAPLPPVAPLESDAADVVVPEAAPAVPAVPRVREVPRPKRVAPPAHNPAQCGLIVSTDDFAKSIKDAFASDQTWKAFKTKNRRFILVTPS
jgi:hypothetical protein